MNAPSRTAHWCLLVAAVALGCAARPRLVESASVASAPVARAAPSPQVATTLRARSGAPAIAADFTEATQLYCNGGCSWAGGDGCDQADADVYCRLTTGDLHAVATRFSLRTADNGPSFPCAVFHHGSPIEPRPDLPLSLAPTFLSEGLLRTHGAGAVVADVQCARSASSAEVAAAPTRAD